MGRVSLVTQNNYFMKVGSLKIYPNALVFKHMKNRKIALIFDEKGNIKIEAIRADHTKEELEEIKKNNPDSIVMDRATVLFMNLSPETFEGLRSLLDCYDRIKENKINGNEYPSGSTWPMIDKENADINKT